MGLMRLRLYSLFSLLIVAILTFYIFLETTQAAILLILRLYWERIFKMLQFIISIGPVRLRLARMAVMLFCIVQPILWLLSRRLLKLLQRRLMFLIFQSTWILMLFKCPILFLSFSGDGGASEACPICP